MLAGVNPEHAQILFLLLQLTHDHAPWMDLVFGQMTPDPVYTEGDPVSYACVKTKLFDFVIVKLLNLSGQKSYGY